MTPTLRMQGFEPLAIHLAHVGPFQRDPETVEFTTSREEPSNFFILLSRNGRGKTTILEALVHLVGLIAPDDAETTRGTAWSRDFPEAELQLDILVRMRTPTGGQQCAVLSVVDGVPESGALRPWTQADLERVGAEVWLRCGRVRTQGGALRDLWVEENLGVDDIRAVLRGAQGRMPAGFEIDSPDGPSELAPTVLYFPDDRGLVRHDGEVALSQHSDWRYRTVQRFGREDSSWQGSTDYLLVWLHWLDDGKGRFTRAQKLVDEIVFAGTPKFVKRIDKQHLRTVIGNGPDMEHRLDQLSSGERALVHLFVRLGAAMTRNTWVVIDELDLHLHPEWRRWAVVHLKELVRRTPGLTVIFTAHSKETLDWFDPDVDEPPLRKSGHIIQEGFIVAAPWDVGE